MKLLLWDTDVDAKDKTGSTALTYASKTGNLVLVKLLCDYSADPDVVDLLKRSPLLHAARWGYVEVCRILLDRGADVDLRDRRGWTALMFACYWNKTECVKLLIEEEAELNIRDRVTGKTALAWSAEKSLLDIVALLLRSGVNPTIPDIHGRTPLQLAVGVLVKDIIQEYVDSYTDELPSESDDSGSTVSS